MVNARRRRWLRARSRAPLKLFKMRCTRAGLTSAPDNGCVARNNNAAAARVPRPPVASAGSAAERARAQAPAPRAAPAVDEPLATSRWWAHGASFDEGACARFEPSGAGHACARCGRAATAHVLVAEGGAGVAGAAAALFVRLRNARVLVGGVADDAAAALGDERFDQASDYACLLNARCSHLYMTILLT